MIDIDFIKSKIFKQEEERKIHGGDTIPNEAVQILRQGKTSTIRECFAAYNACYNADGYLVECVCCKCGETEYIEMNKTEVMSFLTSKESYKCYRCSNKIDNR